jgi:hypothetical protein
VLGWGDWFLWSVPALLSEVVKLAAEPIAAHSVIMVLMAFIAGITATFAWWRMADQAN